jgi:hypothetical protein
MEATALYGTYAIRVYVKKQNSKVGPDALFM